MQNEKRFAMIFPTLQLGRKCDTILSMVQTTAGSRHTYFVGLDISNRGGRKLWSGGRAGSNSEKDINFFQLPVS
jgi:hypothetical protein